MTARPLRIVQWTTGDVARQAVVASLPGIVTYADLPPVVAPFAT